MSESMWEQDAYGFEMLVNHRDVWVLDRKVGPSTSRKATDDYKDFVVDAHTDLRMDGWKGRVSAEAHEGDAGIKQQWAFAFDKKAEMFEALYADNYSLEKLEYMAALNKGRGWRFPKIFVYEIGEPESEELSIMKKHKCPYCMLQYSDVPPDDDDDTVEPPGTSFQIAVITRLDTIVGLLTDG